MKDLIDSSVLLEAISNKDLPEAVKYYKRKVVFIISPDPFENNHKINDYLRYGMRAATDSGRRTECPVLCYTIKLGLYGFNQWNLQAGPFSKQQLFDMQVSQMLRCNYVAVYGNEYTESMNILLNVAKLTIPRIDFRTI